MAASSRRLGPARMSIIGSGNSYQPPGLLTLGWGLPRSGVPLDGGLRFDSRQHRFASREDRMGQAIVVTRKDHTAAELRELAAQSDDGAQVRRLLALALILEGRSRTEAAEQCGMDRQTLRDWVHRYNAAG